MFFAEAGLVCERRRVFARREKKRHRNVKVASRQAKRQFHFTRKQFLFMCAVEEAWGNEARDEEEGT